LPQKTSRFECGDDGALLINSSVAFQHFSTIQDEFLIGFGEV
jgi:hypothetical protein